MTELHIVSTGKQSLAHFSEIASEIHEHVDRIHIRENHRKAAEIADWVEALTEVGVPLEKIVVNDRVDVAYALGAGGVQLAHHSLGVSQVKACFPRLRVGKSVHSVEEALCTERHGADYVLYGHVYATKSKPGMAPKGLGALEMLANQVQLPVVAIGGITPENTIDVLRAGAHGIAVLSGILQAEDPLAAVKKYREKIEEVHDAKAL